MKRKKRTTIYDIAEKLNIAASSVSRALNNSGNLNEETRNLILATAAELNYNRNSLASNLRKGQSRTIGVVVPRINQNFFSCGIFDKSTKIWFMDPSSLPTTFTLDNVPPSDIIKINSDKAPYNLMTSAEKGRQGDALSKKEQERISRNPDQ